MLCVAPVSVGVSSHMLHKALYIESCVLCGNHVNIVADDSTCDSHYFLYWTLLFQR